MKIRKLRLVAGALLVAALLSWPLRSVAVQGYNAITEWGYRFLPIAGSAKPDNCKTGTVCMFASPAPTPQPYWWDGASVAPIEICTATNGACGSALSIGSPITSATAKSVLFADLSGNLGQDNSNLSYDPGTLTLFTEGGFASDGPVVASEFQISLLGNSIFLDGTPTANRHQTLVDYDGTLGILRSAAGLDVASLGTGSQSTTIASLSTPTSGIYRVSIVVSCTASDTVNAQVTYTDAVNNTAQTLTPITGSCGTNSTLSAVVAVRAKNTTTLVAKISLSSQSTTKASATIERLF